MEDASLSDLLVKNEKEFSKWFSEIKPWDPFKVPKTRAIWLKVIGVPAHTWNEKFFEQLSQLFGSFVSIDESTRAKVRLDLARVLVSTSVPEMINGVVEVKADGNTFSIQILEELFGDNTSRFVSDWKYQNSEGLSSNDDDSLANNIQMVPETELTEGLREEDLAELTMELSNSKFGENPTTEANGTLSCKRDSKDRGLRSGGYT